MSVPVSVREWTGFTVVHVLLASIVRIVVSTGGVQVIGLGWYVLKFTR